MKINIKRAYEKADKADGTRILVDRLWPRGVSKTKAKIDIWAKGVAPSTALRKWFHADPDRRYAVFAKKFAAELGRNPEAKAFRAQAKKFKTVTLVTAVKDPARSHVPAIVSYIRR